MIASANLPMPVLSVALLVSVTALAASIELRTRRAKQSRGLLAGSVAAAEILKDTDCLKAKISKLQKKMAALRETVLHFEAREAVAGVRARGERHKNAATGDKSHEAGLKLRRFIDLTTEWQRLTGLKLRGSATDDFQCIQDARPGAFQAARRVVEYLVTASVCGGSSPEVEALQSLLREVTSMVKMDLIEPQRGQPYDSSLHEVLDTVAAGSSKQGTIAEVSVNGLHRGNDSIMKAKVYLYD